MGSVNRVTLIGNLGRDAELKYTTGGSAVAKFSLATTEVWNDRSGQKQERTEWHNIDLWGKAAEAVAEYLQKGKQVYVEGKLQTQEWEKDGQKRRSTVIRADKIVLLGGNGRGPQRERHVSDEAVAAESGSSGFDHNHVNDDDIPF